MIKIGTFLSLTFAAMLTAEQLQALQIRHSIGQERLSAHISAHELNRIMVEGDRISQVFGASGLFVVETDEVQGQIFIRPTSEAAQSPFTITVVTEEGLTQDLFLTPRNTPAETILIKGRSRKEALKWETSSPYKETLIRFMQAMTQNHPIAGYGVESCHQPLSLWRDLEMARIKIYKGDKLEGHVFFLKNRSSRPVVLFEKQFLIEPRITAVAIKQRRLKPGEATQVLMVKHA